MMELKPEKHLIDFHIHSTFSDGQLSIPEIVDLYGSKGFSAIAITDHLTDTKTLTGHVSRKLNLSLHESTFDLYLQTLKSEAERAYKKYKMLLIPGLEITLNSWSRSEGAHLLFLNIQNYINPNQSIEKILIENKNCFKMAAHPLWEKSFEFKTTHLWENREHYADLFDVWECGTGSFFSEKIFTSGLVTMANSDFHGSHYKPTWKSMVYTKEKSPESFFQAIQKRQLDPVWI